MMQDSGGSLRNPPGPGGPARRCHRRRARMGTDSRGRQRAQRQGQRDALNSSLPVLPGYGTAAG
jgi:hypothetical protein